MRVAREASASGSEFDTVAFDLSPYWLACLLQHHEVYGTVADYLFSETPAVPKPIRREI